MTTLIPKYTQVTTANRTIAEKFAEAISVKDYGAVGDGVTDDTTAVNAAITACVNSQQQKLYFPAGTYIVASQLNVSQCSVYGAGANSSIIKVKAGFTAESLLYVGSLSQNHVYQDFQLNGNNVAAIKGLILEGNVLHDRFSTIKISNFKGNALVIRNGDAGSTRPSVNTFIDLRIITNDGHGLYYTSGRQNTFINCDFEALGKSGIYADGSVAPTDMPSVSTFQECWVENIGLITTTSDAIYLNNVNSIDFNHCHVSSYGTNPATNGHGIHLLDSLFCTLRACDVGRNNSGASTPTSASYRLQGGQRNRLIQLASNVVSADVSNTSADYAVLAPYQTSIANGVNLYTANHDAIAAAASIYIQVGTGISYASYNIARSLTPSRCNFVSMFAESSTLPTGAETYIITLYKNGVATTNTLTLTNANSGSASLIGTEIPFVAGDYFAIRVDTSAGAATLPAGQLRVSFGQLLY